MIFTQKLLYFVLSLSILIMLGIAQYFVLGKFVEIFTYSWGIKLLVMLIAIIIINPILTKMIMELLPFEAKNLKKQKIKKTRSVHDIKA